MKINTGSIRKRKGIQSWTCYIWYMKIIAEGENGTLETKQEVYIHADSKGQCKQRVEEQLDKIQKEHGNNIR